MQYELNFCCELHTIANVRDLTPMAFNEFIFFGRGLQDDYCPFTGRFDLRGVNNQPLVALPSDKHYYELLQYLSTRYHAVVLYTDMINIFHHSGKIGMTRCHVDQSFVDWLRSRSELYGVDGGIFFNAALHVYYGMLAENCHEGTRLGSRMKLNGIWELFFGCGHIETATCCNRGRSVAEIDAQCQSRGIFLP